jgi:hypothetical protein
MGEEGRAASGNMPSIHSSNAKRMRVLKRALSDVKLRYREDSMYCKAYVSGRNKDLAEVVRRMCEAHWLHRYTVYTRLQMDLKARDPKLTWREVSDRAKEMILQARGGGGDFPGGWSWLERDEMVRNRMKMADAQAVVDFHVGTGEPWVLLRSLYDGSGAHLNWLLPGTWLSLLREKIPNPFKFLSCFDDDAFGDQVDTLSDQACVLVAGPDGLEMRFSPRAFDDLFDIADVIVSDMCCE